MAGAEAFLDPDWRRKLPTETHSMFWELFLAATLLSHGYRLAPKLKAHGPDLAVSLPNGSTLWIEATAPGPGDPTKPDSVPEIPAGIASRVPTDRIVLRITQALGEKHAAILRYRAAGLIGVDDPVVIAINGKHAAQGRYDGNPSYIERACFAAGDLTIDVGPATPRREAFLASAPSIQKSNGKDCASNFFVDPEDPRSAISAVIFATNDIANHTGIYGDALGSEFTVVHNPAAAAPLPQDFPGVGTAVRISFEDEGWGRIQRTVIGTR